MTPRLINAAVGLAEVLARENAALRAMDLAGAAAMLPEKARALDAFTAAQHDAPDRGVSPVARDVAVRLGALAAENRTLLERGIAVQGRLLGMLARAARPAPLRYAAHGGPAGERGAAMTLSARA